MNMLTKMLLGGVVLISIILGLVASAGASTSERGCQGRFKDFRGFRNSRFNPGMGQWIKPGMGERIPNGTFNPGTGERTINGRFNHRMGGGRVNNTFNPRMREGMKDKMEGMRETRELMEQALESGDYEAWKAIMDGLERPPLFADMITEENFNTFAALHQAREDGDFEAARALAEQLGLKGGGLGMHRGRRHLEGKRGWGMGQPQE